MLLLVTAIVFCFGDLHGWGEGLYVVTPKSLYGVSDGYNNATIAWASFAKLECLKSGKFFNKRCSFLSN